MTRADKFVDEKGRQHFVSQGKVCVDEGEPVTIHSKTYYYIDVKNQGCRKCAFRDIPDLCRNFRCLGDEAYVTEETFLKMRMRGEV